MNGASVIWTATQTAGRGEISTSASSLPMKLVGPDVVVHARRPEAWARLVHRDTALLDFLRRGGRTGRAP